MKARDIEIERGEKRKITRMNDKLLEYVKKSTKIEGRQRRDMEKLAEED